MALNTVNAEFLFGTVSEAALEFGFDAREVGALAFSGGAAGGAKKGGRKGGRKVAKKGGARKVAKKGGARKVAKKVAKKAARRRAPAPI